MNFSTTRHCINVEYMKNTALVTEYIATVCSRLLEQPMAVSMWCVCVCVCAVSGCNFPPLPSSFPSFLSVPLTSTINSLSCTTDITSIALSCTINTTSNYHLVRALVVVVAPWHRFLLRSMHRLFVQQCSVPRSDNRQRWHCCVLLQVPLSSRQL
jgi:hypothetical protein